MSSVTRSFRAVVPQPKWRASDFVSEQAFRKWMRSQLLACQPHLAPDRPNLVVLTELNGLPLVLRGAGWAVRLGTFERAAAALVLARLGRVLPVLWRERVSPIRALQLADGDRNARLYLQTCRELAQEFGVYLCCGSTPMPRYRLHGTELRRDPGVLTNQTVIFGPQGELIGCTDKVHLTPAEEAQGVDLSPGNLSELRVFPTPVGDLGVAISLDAFRPDVMGRLEAQGCTVLLQPDANASPWTAPEGLPPNPAQVRDQPVAWLESSWQVTAHSPRIRYALNPMVVGNLLNLTFDGQSAITGPAQEAPEPRSYVLTDPRPGFLALAPWVAQGTPEALRELGRHLAAGSGHPRENAYLETVLSADLRLDTPPVPTPACTPHEEALRAWLNGQATFPQKQPRLATTMILGTVLLGLAGLTWRRRRPQASRR